MKKVRKEFPAAPSAIPAVHDFVKGTLQKHGIARHSSDDIVLACDEAATNIVEHAFAGKGKSISRKNSFVLALHCRKDCVTATFFDSGEAFNMDAIEPPDIRKNLRGERTGGYGVFLIRKLVDKIVYSARRRLNVTRLIKVV